MLVQRFTNTLPNIEDEELMFDEISQLRTTIEKNRKKRKIFQNKCVSSQQTSVRRWRYRSGYTYLLFGETARAGLARAERAAILHGDIQLYRRKPP
jgi:hypothetical protein